MQNIQIKGEVQAKTNCAITRIFIDGHEIHDVRSFTLLQDSVHSLPILKLELNATNCETSLSDAYIKKLRANVEKEKK
ncbi:MAG: hypothetical protein E7572_05080 [Ruminococcaceae bacterium]|jgi:hypothetical protein|nr:hypothetical protein [Oscillospiraceae bacterium]